MSSVLVPLALAGALWLLPAWLARRTAGASAADDLVASAATRPEVVRNASIAYALRLSAFAPLLAWGAQGELWLAVGASAFFAAGVLLIHAARRPLLEFLDAALREDRSITVHAFIAQAHGDVPRVRALAAMLSLCALFAILVVEALALAAWLKPMVGGVAAIAEALVLAALFAIVFASMRGGHTATLHAAQLQLGIVYLGLFGATVVLLYVHASARTPLPPHASLALVFLAALSAALLIYRRSKYVDTDAIRADATSVPSRLARGLSRAGKVLNVWLSVFLVLVIVIVLLDLQAAGWRAVARDGAAALAAGTRFPAVALLALAFALLVYPLVDVTNWLRLAAIRKGSTGTDPNRRSASLASVFRIYAADSALAGCFVCMLGAIAAIATGTQPRTGPLPGFVAALVAADNAVTAAAPPLLLLAVVAAALSTMGALYAAAVATLGYDLLPALARSPPGERRPPAIGGATERRRRVAAVAFALAAAAVFCVADAALPIDFAAERFVALLLAAACLQLSLAPLVLGALIGHACGAAARVRPGWALAILGAGAASAVAAIGAYAVADDPAWLWAAGPLCIASSSVLYALACVASRRVAARRPESRAVD